MPKLVHPRWTAALRSLGCPAIFADQPSGGLSALDPGSDVDTVATRNSGRCCEHWRADLAISLLYAEPPHLSVAMYGDGTPDSSAFALVCRTVAVRGGLQNGVVRISQADEGFEWVSDLTGRSVEVEVSSDLFWDMVDGQANGSRAVKAGFTAEPVGLVVVTYELTKDGERSPHPVAALMSAGPLGIPRDYWSGDDEARAREIGAWATGLLKAICHRARPLYAALAIEETLPVPSHLDDLVSGDVFISGHLLAADPDLETDLREFYGQDRLSQWDTGIYCADWAGFHPDQIYSKQVADAGRWAGARIRRAIDCADHEDLRDGQGGA